MSEEINQNRDATNIIKIILMMIPSMPSLLFRLFGTLLRFKSDANKAGKVFQRELRNHGLDKKMASDLTNIYLEGSNLIKLMTNFR
ncbi:hypothetical protein AYK20_01615 [Thermoplasmatales archaeon SG8-52-1]|nr:MAG: hypothetical protein AYK20_01615 [Thermoplasmatales archaeon SG8-52-1]